jgi:cell division protease FtsH
MSMSQTTSEPTQQPERSDSAASRRTTPDREQLDRLAQALLERETLDEADAHAVAGIPQPAAVAQPVAVGA